MLANKIFLSNSKPDIRFPQKIHSKNYKHKKNHRSSNSGEDKQNQYLKSNIPGSVVVDLSKKIKKREYKKPNKLSKKETTDQLRDFESFLGQPVFQQEELGYDDELVNLIRPQRLDNDLDTDQEQVEAGQRQMLGFLRDACREKRLQQYEDEYEMMGQIMDAADVAIMEEEGDI